LVTSWNAAAERIFGYTAPEIVGRPMATIIPDDRRHEETEILARIARGEKVDHIETVRRRKDGTLVNVSATISPIFDDDGRVVGASKIARDVTERVQAQRTIWMQANFDALTRLPNRRQFIEKLHGELARARSTDKHLAVMFVDLDRFKAVNDSLGHGAGDELLVQAAERLRRSLRDTDTLARMGGDEFTVLLPGLNDPEQTETLARRLNQCLFEPFVIDDKAIQISASIGIALFPNDGQSVDDLLRRADQAMYESKKNGRNQTRRFMQSMRDGALDQLQLAVDLRHAIERDELHLVYQPIVALRDGAVVQCEALLRWRHPRHGAIPPSRFIPLAEETGLIGTIGDWVFETAARQAKTWRQAYGERVRVGLNVSPAQLQSDTAWADRWFAFLDSLELPGSSLVVEVTESMMIERSSRASEILRALRSRGFSVAIDDFGVGYSSLAYLSRLDVDHLKIDQTFMRTIESNPRDLVLCEAIVAMAHKLGLQVVAEGVETEGQRRLLREIGCDLAQGYHFSPPVAAEALERLIALADLPPGCAEPPDPTPGETIAGAPIGQGSGGVSVSRTVRPELADPAAPAALEP
ncbi:MAG TPA: EAL domain-containing protein, partial [Burkholderiaceae bacterium]|nr:EAL domain-containing protein [Burkholderiaceae bacterium]